MHKVQRNEPPEGLNEKNIEFNKENHSKEEVKNTWNSFINTNLKKKTVEQLKKMFKGCCAYCEGSYEGTSYPQIEHFKPKSLYPELMFDYNNMNLACQICNMTKLDKYNEKLINPTEDEPDEHLKYKAYMICALDERGKTTIDMLNLNSEERTGKREEDYNKINDRLQLINKWIERMDEENEKITQSFIELIDQTVKDVKSKFEEDYEYSTMYRHNFKEIIEELDKFLKKVS